MPAGIWPRCSCSRLFTLLLLRIISVGALQYSSKKTPESTWVPLCDCHAGWSWTDLASLSILSLSSMWTDSASLSWRSLNFGYWTCRAGGRYIISWRRLALGTPCIFLVIRLPSVKVGHLIYLYIMYHPCCVVICIHLQCHKPSQIPPSSHQPWW